MNDQPEHARELVQLLGPEGFHVNLIACLPPPLAATKRRRREARSQRAARA